MPRVAVGFLVMLITVASTQRAQACSLDCPAAVRLLGGPGPIPGNLVYFKGMKLQDAVDQVIHKELEALHGDGGVIAITPDGQLAWSFNTPGMFRAKLVEGGQVQMGIYNDEP